METIMKTISKILELSSAQTFIKKHKVDENAFLRKRKITATHVVLFVLSLIKTTLPFEILHFVNKSSMPLVVAGSITKARNKLSFTAFVELFEQTADEILPCKLYRGYRLLAIDGMQGELPRTKELLQKYPLKNANLYPMFHAVAIFDVLNKTFLKASFLPAPTDERKAAIDIISNMSHYENEIFLLDRGFPSLALLQTFDKTGKHFVMRVKRNFLREVTTFIRSDATDSVMEIEYSKRRGATHKVLNAMLPYKLNLRCVKIVLPSSEIETLITNLPIDEFSADDISELYNMRWGIETSYNHLKNAIKIEEFVGKTENSIKQEFYASLLFFNMTILFANIAQDVYDAKKNEQNTPTKST